MGREGGHHAEDVSGLSGHSSTWRWSTRTKRFGVTSSPKRATTTSPLFASGVARMATMSPLRRPVRSILSPRTVKDLGTLAEVDLRHLAGVELQYGGDLWVSGLDACEETAHRGVRAGEAVAANQGAVDGGALDSLTPPTRDPLAMWFSLRGDRGLCAHRTQVHGKLGVAGQPRRDPGLWRVLAGWARPPGISAGELRPKR